MRKTQNRTYNRLMLLYILNSLNAKISENEFVRIVAENDWIDYFEFKEALVDLADNSLVNGKKFVNGNLYTISDVGKETLGFFQKELDYSLRRSVDEYCSAHRSEIELRSRLHSEYFRMSDKEYRVVLKIFENESLVFELCLKARSKDEADHYSKTWHKLAIPIYKNTFEMLNSL